MSVPRRLGSSTFAKGSRTVFSGHQALESAPSIVDKIVVFIVKLISRKSAVHPLSTGGQKMVDRCQISWIYGRMD